MNYLNENVIHSFSNFDLRTEIHLMHDQVEEIMEKHDNYYRAGECLFIEKMNNVSHYLTLLEKEWIKRHNDFISKRYHNVNQFLN